MLVDILCHHARKLYNSEKEVEKKVLWSTYAFL